MKEVDWKGLEEVFKLFISDVFSQFIIDAFLDF